MVEERLSEHFLLKEFFTHNGGFDQESWDYLKKDPNKASILANLRKLADRLEVVRGLIGKPIQITSGYRCPPLNKRLGGASASYHMKGMAADFVISTADQKKASLTKWVGGYGQAPTWCHLDIRPYKARWKYT